jgi:hypothetical protein
MKITPNYFYSGMKANVILDFKMDETTAKGIEIKNGTLLQVSLSNVTLNMKGCKQKTKESNEITVLQT